MEFITVWFMEKKIDVARPGETRLRAKYLFKLKDSHCEKTVGPSMAVPDESKSIREILERHTRNMPISGLYRDGLDLPNAEFDDMDLEKVRSADLYDREEALSLSDAHTKKARKALKDPPKGEASATQAKSGKDDDEGGGVPAKPGSESPKPKGGS